MNIQKLAGRLFVGRYYIKQVRPRGFVMLGRVVMKNSVDWKALYAEHNGDMWEVTFLITQTPKRTYLKFPFMRRQADEAET